jgi:hypothetical protein
VAPVYLLFVSVVGTTPGATLQLSTRFRISSIEWNEIFEVESLEAFVKETNQRVRESGVNTDVCCMESATRVRKVSAVDGTFEGTYYAWDAKNHRYL